MKMLLSVLLGAALVFSAAGFLQAQDKKKTYGSGSPAPAKSDPPKSYGSGQPKSDPKPPKPDPPKSYGSGRPPDQKADTKPSGGKYGSGQPDNKSADPAKKYGSGHPDTHAPPTHKDAGSKPKGQYDQKAAQAAQKEESKKKFEAGKAPAPSYKDPKGNEVKIDPKDKKIAQLRQQLDYQKLENRELRERNFYTTYYSRPVVVYHDPYSSFFWWWLLDRSIEQQAMWAYNHRYDMDSARYNDLLSRNAELAARVRALEASGTPRNPAYVPQGMSDYDLMYDTNYVKAAYNPTPVATAPYSGPSAGQVFTVMLYILVGLAIVALIVWLVFVKKW